MKKTLLASVAAISLFAATNLAAAQGANPGGTKEAPAPKADTPPPPAGTQAPGAGRSADPAAKEKADPKATQQRTPDKAGTKAIAPATKAGMQKAILSPLLRIRSRQQVRANPRRRIPSRLLVRLSPQLPKKSPARLDRPQQLLLRPLRNALKSLRRSSSRTLKKSPTSTSTFRLAPGCHVPSLTIRSHSQVIEIYPEWRGYYFILVNGRYLILRPQTYEIVYIIEG